MAATGGDEILLRMLADAGVRYLFGNPGTTELPLIDALVESRGSNTSSACKKCR